MIITSASERDSIPYQFGPIVVAGALASGVSVQEFYVNEAFTIKNVAGCVETAPSGGVCTVDVQVDTGGGFGSVIGGADSNKIYIADGTTTDVSDDVWFEVAQGAKLRIEIIGTSGSPNGAEDLAVTINGRIGCKDVEVL